MRANDKKTFWAVFDEAGRIWLCSIRGSRAASIKSWRMEHAGNDRLSWVPWRRRGYTCDKIQLVRI